MRILITNDDGYDAPGLVALYKAASQLGDVFVAPPAECHSSKGHAVCTKSIMRVTEHDVPEIGKVHAIHSSPADCVRIALELMPEPPDLVLAGINPGANLGVDVYYSGTVAAAREAAILGFRAVAVSTYMRADIELSWPDKTQLTVECLPKLLDVSTSPGQFWNLNFPAVQPGGKTGPLKFTRQSTEPQGVAYEPCPDTPNGFQFTGNYQQRPAAQDADVQAVFGGAISATLLQLDTSAEVQTT
ncbi:MAG: 5'/3'-nucleotidase SurE [Planctomycetaceae bacterium]